eukprot:6197258-Pleurochrysis_carterae.AAC.3
MHGLLMRDRIAPSDSIVKAVFYPTKRVGPWCNSPMEFCAKNTENMKHLNGGIKMLWQLANFNFEGCLAECEGEILAVHVGLELSRPGRPQNHVCVIQKTNLADLATNTQPEFKPFLAAAPDSTQEPTDPLGVKFMLRAPSLYNDPGVEMWKGNSNSEKEGSADAS